MNDEPGDVTPQSRTEEILLSAIDNYGVGSLPKPSSHVEAYLMALVGRMINASKNPDWSQIDPNAVDYVKNRSLLVANEIEIGYFDEDFMGYNDEETYHANKSTATVVVNDETIVIPVTPGRYYTMGNLDTYGIFFDAPSMSPTRYKVSYSKNRFPDGIRSIKIIGMQYEKLPIESTPDELLWAYGYDYNNIVDEERLTNYVRVFTERISNTKKLNYDEASFIGMKQTKNIIYAYTDREYLDPFKWKSINDGFESLPIYSCYTRE